MKYYEEMRGLADGSGVPFNYFKRISMIGELTKGACSMFGAWGKATPNGNVVQLRALDWDFDGPYRKYPLAIIYHPSNPKDGNKWMNIGFMGWLGVISGVNEHRVAVS
jgi:isopenicillin-N N-acyltransferase-like protein